MRLRWSGFAVAVLSGGLLGVDACFYPFPDFVPPQIIDDPDARCAPLASSNPPSLAFEASGAPVWVVDPTPRQIAPFDVEMEPPTLSAGGEISVPGTGRPARITFLEPLGIPGIPTSLALVTATVRDEVTLFDATARQFVPLEISVPATLSSPIYPRLPDPGTPEVTGGTVLSAFACLETDRLDSKGMAVPGADAPCTAGFYTSRATGAAVAGPTLTPSLFVSVANPGIEGSGTADPQYYPGAVLVYSLGITTGLDVAPDADVPVIFTSGFNPTQVTAYDAAGRHFILVTVSGVIGDVPDLGGTEEVEDGFVAQTPAFIDVIDADTPALVATIPLGEAGLVGNLTVHPSGNYAVVGSMTDRTVWTIDLSPTVVATFPTTTPIGGVEEFDLASSYPIPHRADGATETFCPGLVAGLAFNTAGTMLYATDYCDGTFSVIATGSSPESLSGNPTVVDLTAPIDTDVTTSPRGLGAVAVRPGSPSSFAGPDVFVLVGEPSGLLCAVAVESGT